VLKSSKEVEKDSAENPRSLESTGGATWLHKYIFYK